MSAQRARSVGVDQQLELIFEFRAQVEQRLDCDEDGERCHALIITILRLEALWIFGARVAGVTSSVPAAACAAGLAGCEALQRTPHARAVSRRVRDVSYVQQLSSLDVIKADSG